MAPATQGYWGIVRPCQSGCTKQEHSNVAANPVSWSLFSSGLIHLVPDIFSLLIRSMEKTLYSVSVLHLNILYEKTATGLCECHLICIEGLYSIEAICQCLGFNTACTFHLFIILKSSNHFSLPFWHKRHPHSSTHQTHTGTHTFAGIKIDCNIDFLVKAPKSMKIQLPWGLISMKLSQQDIGPHLTWKLCREMSHTWLVCSPHRKMAHLLCYFSGNVLKWISSVYCIMIVLHWQTENIN